MFTEIHDYTERVIAELRAKFDVDKKAFAADVERALSDAKVEALRDVAVLAPDIQAAVQKAAGELEQAVLAVIATHLL